jgi:hypothetical protein
MITTNPPMITSILPESQIIPPPRRGVIEQTCLKDRLPLRPCSSGCRLHRNSRNRRLTEFIFKSAGESADY